jgi:hypothetical protein
MKIASALLLIGLVPLAFGGCSPPSAASHTSSTSTDSPAAETAAASSALPDDGSMADSSQPPEAISPEEPTATEPAEGATAPAPAGGHDAPALSEGSDSPRPKGQRPPPDRTARRPGDAEKITFDDLNLGMQADMVFRPFLVNDRVKELEDQKVSILGFMHGGVETRKGITEFILLKNTECKYGPGGQADHLAEVRLAEGHKTDFQLKAVKVEGTFHVEPYQGVDGNTWSIYVLKDAKVVPQ